MFFYHLCAVLFAFSFATQSAETDWPQQHFRTESFTVPVLSTKQYGSIAPGHLFFEPSSGRGAPHGPTIMHSSGELVWRSPYTHVGGNFDSQQLNGEAVIVCWTGQASKEYATRFGGVHILNSSYHELYFICGNNLDIIPQAHISEHCKLDLHESRITSRGTILVTARNITRADMSSVGGLEDGWIADSMFFELDIATERVLLQWSAYAHRREINMFHISHEPIENKQGVKFGHTQANPWDFFHINAVAEVLDASGNRDGFMVSSRYLWSAIKLNNQGNIEWYLEGSNGGDFSIPTSANFSYQHDIVPETLRGTSLDIHMFDNANGEATSPVRPSSGLTLRLDLATKQVTTLQRYSPRNETISHRTGSFQQLYPSGHVFVDFGVPGILNEFDSNGHLVWEASFGGLQSSSYRAFKKPWKGTPPWLPKVYAEYTSNHSDIYVSWNGDTEAEEWHVFGTTDSKDKVELLAKVPKSGFETKITVKHKVKTVMAIGMKGNKNLGQSKLISAVKAPNKNSGNDLLPANGALELLTLVLALWVLFSYL